MAAEAVAALAFPEEKKKYIIHVLDPILEKMIKELLKQEPKDVTSWMFDHLTMNHHVVDRTRRATLLAKNAELKKALQELNVNLSDMKASSSSSKQNQSKAPQKPDSDDDSDEDDEDDEMEMPPPPPPKHLSKARASVSAEAFGRFNVQNTEWTPAKIPKTDEQMRRIQRILMKSFMFSPLEPKDMETVILAMKERVFPPGSRIITEGEEGDFLCIIEEGSAVCKKNIDGVEKVVKQCKTGDVFGELALLYNAKRAATVESVDRCLAWELDRETFNRIVKDAASKKTALYEEFLKNVRVLSNLDPSDIQKIADVVKERTYTMGEQVITQGDVGDEFFILLEGAMEAHRRNEKGISSKVYTYQIGDYFGEIALMEDQPRAASIIATSIKAKALSLDRKTFKSVLGPLQELLKSKKYT